MENTQPQPEPEPEPKKTISIASDIFEDGTIVEMVYRREDRRTLFATYSAGRWTLVESVPFEGTTLVPFSPHNNLVKNAVVLFPSEPRAYGTEAELISEVQTFIHRYVDLEPAFERIAAHYVLLTWLYDAFNELPYLRFRGDFGSGKTRALLTIGSLCYRGFFASGASTVSPIFHTLDAFRGTFVFDEADFRFSDEKTELVKILNNGNVRGLPVLRTMMNRQREFNPQAFYVFGPKIVGARGTYDDRGLESRFITHEMGARRLRDDIPINLPPEYQEEALVLRNKLLMYRFRNRHDVKLDPSLADRKLEPRFNQILLPLLSIVREESLREELRAIGREAQFGFVTDRGFQVEAHVLEALVVLLMNTDDPVALVKDVTRTVQERYGDEYERLLTNRFIGGVLRKSLRLRTYKSGGVYVVPRTELKVIARLCVRYGVYIEPEREEVAQADEGDIGDVRDVRDVAATQSVGDGLQI